MSMYVVMESSAKMPASCTYPYRRVAVVQLSQEYTAHNKMPKMISERAKGVLRIVSTWQAPANGKTERSGIVQARRQAKELVDRLNNVSTMADAEAIIGAGGSA